MVRRKMNGALQKSALGLIVALVLAPPGAALARGIALFDGKRVAAIVHNGAENTPIANAALLLARDLTALTGEAPRISSGFGGLSGPAVIVGPADAPLIAALLKANQIDPTPITGKWETYGRAVIPAPWDGKEKALLIFGSDMRGTIWGVIDLTREMGISPWEWWGDVGIRKVKRITIAGALRYSREPSVKYRAIFLNDEDFGLFPWAAKTYDAALGDIGPKTYARVFELMWRLKANTIWPAMHNITTPFNQIAGNPEMAASYAIVHATSHAEPMLRNNVREWDVKTMGEFNFLTNKANLLRYWDQRAQESKGFENIYTIGLRGIHDSPMIGAESSRARSQVLQDVITEQRKILERRLGKPADQIPQAFTAYKEVLEAYDAGLALPSDVMLTWPDDNHGYIRRLPNLKERARAGGSGVYYHISYWGSPMSYLWLATTHPALIWEEMNKAYRLDARKIWVLNVGDIKPGEYLTQLLLDMAFDNEALADISSVRAHLTRWAAENFGPEHADAIAAVMWRYYDLAFERRPEFMGFNETYPTTVLRPTEFNSLAYGDENARRADAYRAIAQQADSLMRALPKDRQDGFTELVQYPVEAAAEINERALATDKAIAYGLQRRASANLYSQRATAAQARLFEGERAYNDGVAAGKWRGMMSIAPHRLPVFAAPAVPDWQGSADAGCAIQTEGGEFYEGGGSAPEHLVFHRELPQSRYIDIFVKSRAAVNWTATASAPWIKLSMTSGKYAPDGALEARILVTVDWRRAPAEGEGTIIIGCDTTPKPLPVRIHIAPPNPISNVSFIEVDRVVSIYATHTNERSAGWDVLVGLGHTGSSLRSKLETTSVEPDAAALSGAPNALYRFATITESDKAKLRIIALPTMPVTSDNRLRIAVAIDGGTPAVLDLATAEFSQEWRHNVLTNTAVGEIANLKLRPGAHVLKFYALDPGLILDRFELAFTGAQPAYGPVPETRITR
jgi:hypothetical protein